MNKAGNVSSYGEFLDSFQIIRYFDRYTTFAEIYLLISIRYCTFEVPV